MMGFNTETPKLTPKIMMLFGSALIFLAIAFGAFGAHGLKSILDETKLNTFNTGVTYQFYHGFGLLILGLTKLQVSGLKLNWAFTFMLLGVILFSFNCYIYALTGLKLFALIVPIGGVSFLLGWLFFFLSLRRLGR